MIEHKSGSPQGWHGLDDDIRDFINETVHVLKREVEPCGFVGAYLHGSLSTGTFYRGKSDIDLIVVVERALTPERRGAVAAGLADLSDVRPVLGDLEVSVLLQANAQSFRHPAPYEVHYGENLKDDIRAGLIDYLINHNDPDLAAHVAVLRANGVVLDGVPISEVFGEVSSDVYRSAVWHDILWIIEEDHLIETPFYGVLNCCRWLMQEAEGWHNPVSKDQAGEWALGNLPVEVRPIVAQAMACYRSADPVSAEQRRTDGHQWDEPALRRFREYLSRQVSDNRED